MTALEWWLQGMHDGLTVLIYVTGLVLPFLVAIALAIALGYAIAFAVFVAHTIYLERKRRRLEPGVDRPHGIDSGREGRKP